MAPKLEDLPPPWPGFLKDIDRALSTPAELHCLGGFVLTILYGLPRRTDDLDYVSVIPRDAVRELDALAGRGSNLCKKHKVFLQHVGGISDLPEDHEHRLTKLDLGLPKLSLKVPDPYDLVLSKLSRNSTKDREDVKYLAAELKLSFNVLSQRFEAQMKPWISHPDRHTLTLDLWREYFSD